MDWSLCARDNDGTFKATHFERFFNRETRYFFYCKVLPPSRIPLGKHHKEPSQGKRFKNSIPYPTQEACERGIYLSLTWLSTIYSLSDRAYAGLDKD